MDIRYTYAMCLFVFLPVFSADHKSGCLSNQHLEMGRMGIVQCNFEEGFYAVVWYKLEEFSKGYSFLQLINGVKKGEGYLSGEFDVLSNGSLTIPNVTLQHDRSFIVSKFNSEDEIPISFDIRVVVTVLAYPVISGCIQYQYCFLEAPTEGNLTCAVRGVRPRVNLEWKTLAEEDSALITFNTHEVTVNRIGDVYDVILTSPYRVEDTATDTLTLECKMTSSNISELTTAANVDLFIKSEIPSGVTAARKSSLLWILMIILPLVLPAIYLYRRYFHRGGGGESRTLPLRP